MWRIIPGLLAMLVLVSQAAGDEIAIIVNRDNVDISLTKSDLNKIYTGKRGTWSDGSAIKACDQKFDTSIAKKFLSDCIGKEVEDYQALWMQQMLSGAGTPPKSFASDAEVVDYVAANKDAIGYIAISSLSNRVATVKLK